MPEIAVFCPKFPPRRSKHKEIKLQKCPFLGPFWPQNGRIGDGCFTVGFILGSKQPKMGTLGFENNNKKTGSGVSGGVILGSFWVFLGQEEKNRKFESETTAAFGGKTALFGQRRGKKKAEFLGWKRAVLGNLGFGVKVEDFGRWELKNGCFYGGSVQFFLFEGGFINPGGGINEN